MVVSGITRARPGLPGAAQLKPVLKRIATESSFFFFFFLAPFYDPRPGLRRLLGLVVLPREPCWPGTSAPNVPFGLEKCLLGVEVSLSGIPGGSPFL